MSCALNCPLTCAFLDRKWVAYSKLYQTLEVDSSVLFQQLTSIEYHWHQQELPYQQVYLEGLKVQIYIYRIAAHFHFTVFSYFTRVVFISLFKLSLFVTVKMSILHPVPKFHLHKNVRL